MSRLSIFPPVVKAFPLDRITFTAKATPSPPLWFSVLASGDIKSDFSLEVDAAGSSVAGAGGHELKSGIGSVEITVDDQCRPTSTNLLSIEGFINDISGFGYIYAIRISSTTVKVFDEIPNEIFSMAHTLASGDKFKLELQAGFRLFLNGVNLHSSLGLFTTVKYPMGYIIRLEEPVAAAPAAARIPPPKLTGDWQVGPLLNWTTPSHGSISTLGPSLSTEYYGGTSVGRYELACSMEAANDATGVQRATAVIEIPALTILGPASVTMQPGEKRRFKTNYDDAQNKLITWSVVSGGGSFTQDEFTADTSPGVSVVRATSSANLVSADLTITVPAVVTNPSNYLAAKPSEQIDFETNIPVSSLPQLLSAGGVGVSTIDGTVNFPVGVRDGDLLALIVQTANQAVSTPSGGWTQVADSPQSIGTAGAAGSVRLTVFYNRYSLGLAAPIIADPGDHFAAQIVNLRGVIASGTPWDVTAGDTAASTTAVSIPGDTTTVINCLILAIVANASDTDSPQVTGFTNASLSSFAERGDFNTSTGVGGGFAYATGGKAAAGAYSATTATLGNASAQARMSIAFKPSALTWAASIGSINSSSGLWTAPSLAGQTAIITVTNGHFTATIEVPVLEAFPFPDFSLPVSWDRNLNALVSMSEDRSKRITREKAPAFDSYPVKLNSRTLTECNTFDSFFDRHGLGKMFILEDAVRGIRKVGWFDSPARHEARDECDIDISFQFLEARL